jgi:hypothetical protein
MSAAADGAPASAPPPRAHRGRLVMGGLLALSLTSLWFASAPSVRAARGIAATVGAGWSGGGGSSWWGGTDDEGGDGDGDGDEADEGGEAAASAAADEEAAPDGDGAANVESDAIAKLQRLAGGGSGSASLGGEGEEEASAGGDESGVDGGDAAEPDDAGAGGDEEPAVEPDEPDDEEPASQQPAPPPSKPGGAGGQQPQRSPQQPQPATAASPPPPAPPSLGLGSAVHAACVPMPRKLTILVAALPPVVYPGGAPLTGTETLEEMAAAMWRFGASPSDSRREPYSPIPLTRAVGVRDAERAILIRPRPGLSSAAILQAGERGKRGTLAETVDVAPRRMEALRRLTDEGRRETADALLRPALERLRLRRRMLQQQQQQSSSGGGGGARQLRRGRGGRGRRRGREPAAEVAAAAASPQLPTAGRAAARGRGVPPGPTPFVSPLRYAFSTQTWRDLERVIIHRAMESPYAAVVDMRNVTSAQLAAADAVVVPFPISHMRGRRAMGELFTLALRTYVPTLWDAPRKHVFLFARIMRDADRLPSLAMHFRRLVRMAPYRDARYVSFEPQWSRTLPRGQLVVPYVGAVRRERTTAAARVAGEAAGDGGAGVPISFGATRRHSAVNGVTGGALPPWHPADPAFASRAVVGRPPPTAAAGGKRRLAASNASKPHGADAAGHSTSDWAAQMLAAGVRAFRELSGVDEGGRTAGPDAAGWFPYNTDATAALQCDPTRLADDGTRTDGSGVRCSRQQQWAALHAERPLLVSFIGAPRSSMGERVATIRGLKGCANCGVFDIRGGGPLGELTGSPDSMSFTFLRGAPPLTRNRTDNLHLVYPLQAMVSQWRGSTATRCFARTRMVTRPRARASSTPCCLAASRWYLTGRTPPLVGGHPSCRFRLRSRGATSRRCCHAANGWAPWSAHCSATPRLRSGACNTRWHRLRISRSTPCQLATRATHPRRAPSPVPSVAPMSAGCCASVTAPRTPSTCSRWHWRGTARVVAEVDDGHTLFTRLPTRNTSR